MSTAETKPEKTEGIDMAKAVERLRKSEAARIEAEGKLGLDAGEHWAAYETTAEELLRLSVWYERNEIDNYDWDSTRVGRGILSDCDDGSDLESGAIEDFWKSACSKASPGNEFVTSFASGALDVWDEVTKQL